VWEVQQVGEGIKPTLALDGEGRAHVAFLVEDEHGKVSYASNASGDFAVATVAQGYFYGPVDIAVDEAGTPHIAYHDHQATGFNPELGDEVVARLQGAVWELTTVSHPGHDGWDNSIVVGKDGVWHTASIDPSQFGGRDGVEYATNAGGGIAVSSVGSGPLVYEFGTSIQLRADGTPAIVYYNDREGELEYAVLEGESWTIQVVDAQGDAGRYASLAFDGQGRPHVAYFVATSGRAGEVRYAWLEGDSWQVETVDTLDEVRVGRVGARKITAIAVEAGGTPHLAYSDRGRLVYARRGESGWLGQVVVQAGARPLGQLVEIALDAQGRPHLIWYEVTTFSPILHGLIFYAQGS
jgi:hypothetical protein